MLYKLSLSIVLLLSIIFYPVILHAQSGKTGRSLFENDDILHFKLIGKLNDLFNDRGDNMTYHPLLLQYAGKDSDIVSLHLEAKTRGHFRRMKGNCKMPPLLLNFLKSGKIKNSIFEKQGKLKLVVPCQGDEYVIKEWLVYKLYNILTDRSFRARLAEVDFEDSLGKRKTETHYCILLEDEKKMAERNDAFIWNRKMMPMTRINKDEFQTMAVFQYLIGNTDWGVPYLQNIVLITKDSTKALFAIPYDFDHSGIVDAPYAGAAPELEMPNVRVRMYRGYCENDKKSFANTFELFNKHKNEIYDLYTNCTLLKARYVKYVTRYLDDFYKTINSNKDVEDEFGLPCRTNVRVEIKGLKK
jgi:hypothetical protein